MADSFLDAFSFDDDEGAVEPAAAGLGALSLADGGKRGKKGSKAREKKQREEAEREARMVEARNSAGPDKGALEAKQLDVQLAPLGLRVQEVMADGHCLFRAVAYQVSDTSARPMEDMVWDLRKKSVAHLQAHAVDFEPFFEPTESAPSFEAYCAEMASTAAWGGQMELRALAQVIGRSLRVHQAGAPPVVMNEEAAGEPVELSFHQHAYGLGEHYNALQQR
ncbi:hypothetical protein T492DRAFT_936374 [Pavlovales sp. CCMP2436]|nr:hypothetical protein T492DRAFT_936374 [Pavlovales sp. CCMP2436]|mmetsp:Transcript_15872/g.40469  ORF Transcript_15872/g.40469 Transcript_15872/m.40469 type:complete len:222 (-) Transcript_15872:146-811(-)